MALTPHRISLFHYYCSSIKAVASVATLFVLTKSAAEERAASNSRAGTAPITSLRKTDDDNSGHRQGE